MIPHVIVFDTETRLITPEEQAPPMACVTWCQKRDEGNILHRKAGLLQIQSWLTNDNILLAGHNIAFDMAVVIANEPDLTNLVFRAYERSRITCTQIRESLYDIRLGRFRGYLDEATQEWVRVLYSLSEVSLRTTRRRLDKGADTWRLRYGELLDTPLEAWPKEAKNYAIEDAVANFDLYWYQEARGLVSVDQYAQARFDFAARLSSNYGIRTDPKGVESFKAGVIEEFEASRSSLQSFGLIRKDGTRNIAAARKVMQEACEELNIFPVLTKTGNISLAKDACEIIDNEIIQEYSHYLTIAKVLKNDIEMIEGGVTHPLHPQYGLAESGRTRCYKPNIQNLNRNSKVREVFVPRDGYVFAQADYEGLELSTLAQVCVSLFGESKLADSINAGRDVHTEVAASLLKCSYEEACKRKKDKSDKEFDNARQTGKVLNFGKPGGLGPKRLVFFAKKTYGVDLTISDAIGLSLKWLEQWPEMRKLFAYVSGICEQSGEIEQLFSGRVRGGLKYTAGCNTLFQGLGADVAKNATWLVTHAQNNPTSPLFGSHVVAFIHDELIVEVKDDSTSHDAAEELKRLMILGAKPFLPDVDIRTEPLLMRRWYKSAVPMYNDVGRLIPYGSKILL